jgi:azurin
VRKPLVILFAILSAMMLLAIACGSDEADPNATSTAAPPNTVPASERTAEPPTAVPPTAAPATATSSAATTPPSNGGGKVELDIDVDGDALKFNTGSMTASAGAEVVVNFNNSSSVNTHNWALVEGGTKDAVAIDGTAAGPDNNWLPVNDPRVFGSTILVGPGESVEATFTAPAAGTYQFVCTFPGHNFTMFGDFVIN